MSIENDLKPDKLKMRQAFERAANTYDAAAVIQREVSQRLLERLNYIKLQPARILDAGAGTGISLAGLNQHYPAANIYALDIARPMLIEARKKQGWWQRLRRPVNLITGDAEALPLADASVDLLFSNLALQWCLDLEQTFKEFRRVLKPGGLLMFTTFGPDTLKELRSCWSQVDGYTHVNNFIDMHDIGDALVRNSFAEPVMDMELLTMTYHDVPSLMRDLKTIGAHNVTQGRSRKLTGKGRLHRVISAYEQYRCEGVLPASYEVVYGHAWIAEELSSQTVQVAFDGKNNKDHSLL
jgi:malonyl-CoA O-methyltransferase